MSLSRCSPFSSAKSARSQYCKTFVTAALSVRSSGRPSLKIPVLLFIIPSVSAAFNPFSTGYAMEENARKHTGDFSRPIALSPSMRSNMGVLL